MIIPDKIVRIQGISEAEAKKKGLTPAEDILAIMEGGSSLPNAEDSEF